MKRLGRKGALVALAVFMIAAFLVASCAQPTPTPRPAATARPGDTPTPLPTATPVPVKPIRMKVSSYGGPTYVQRLVIERAMETITRESGGRIEFDYFPGASLLKLDETFEGVRTNVVQLAVTTSVYERERMTLSFEANVMPFSWDVDKWHKAYYEPGGMWEFDNEYWHKYGMHNLAFPRVPYGEVFTRKPVKKLEDMNGLLIRTIASMAPAVKGLGAEPVFITLGELYEALQRGTVDGATTTIQDWNSQKRYEVAKYGVINHIYSGGLHHAVNQEFFNSIPADLQKVISDAFVEAQGWWAGVAFDDYNKQIDLLKSQPGVELFYPDAAEQARWVKAVQPYWDELAKKYPADEYNRLKTLQEALS